MPVMIGEVISITRGDDRYRMLCQGMAETRLANEILRPSADFFVVIMAIYVTDELVAERYLLFLPRENDRHVSHYSGPRNTVLTFAVRLKSATRTST